MGGLILGIIAMMIVNKMKEIEHSNQRLLEALDIKQFLDKDLTSYWCMSLVTV